MLCESKRHEQILTRLSVRRLELERQKLGFDEETKVTIEPEWKFEVKIVDIMLMRMIGRARLISEYTEDKTRTTLYTLEVLLKEINYEP